MSSSIRYKEQFAYISNKRFKTLIEFAIETGHSMAVDAKEFQYVDRLRHKMDSEFWNGFDLSIEQEFSEIGERKFWARCLFDVAHLIFMRKLGNQDVEFWQSSAIGDAYIFARMLTRSVQEEELAWHPRTIASIEAEAFDNGGVNVGL